MRIVALVSLAVLAQPALASTGKVCVIQKSFCKSLHSAENVVEFNRFRKDPSQYTQNEADLASIYFNVFNKKQAEADGCVDNRRVTLDGFKTYIVLERDQEKRAMMVSGKDRCVWIKVK